MGIGGQYHAPGPFNPRDRASGYQQIGAWVDPRVGMDAMK